MFTTSVIITNRKKLIKDYASNSFIKLSSNQKWELIGISALYKDSVIRNYKWITNGSRLIQLPNSPNNKVDILLYKIGLLRQQSRPINIRIEAIDNGV